MPDPIDPPDPANPNPGVDPAKDKKDLPLQKPATPELVTIPKDELEALKNGITSLGKRFDEDLATRQADSARATTVKAANELGAKDPGYFQYLAEQARAAKGKEFDLAKFGAELKTSRPDLFSVVPGATTTAGHDNSPEKISSLQTEYEEARKKGDISKMLSLKTELTKLGSQPK